MAGNTSEFFPLTGLAAGTPVRLDTYNADPSGQSGSFETLVTADADGSVVSSILFYGVGNTGSGCMIRIFYNTGAQRTLLGEVRVQPGVVPGNDTPCWSASWLCPISTYLIAGDTIDACLSDRTCEVHATPIGYDL